MRKNSHFYERGFRVYECPQCHRKRRIFDTGLRREEHPEGQKTRRYRTMRCSQLHRWDVEIGTLEQINEITQQVITPHLVNEVFRDSPLLGNLRRR